PHRVHREAPLAQLAHRLLERLLVGADLEVHQRSLGRPRMRSPTMLRWICEVPAAMLTDRACRCPCTWSALPSPSTSSWARAARPSTRKASSPKRWRTSE